MKEQRDGELNGGLVLLFLFAAMVFILCGIRT